MQKDIFFLFQSVWIECYFLIPLMRKKNYVSGAYNSQNIIIIILLKLLVHGFTVVHLPLHLPLHLAGSESEVTAIRLQKPFTPQFDPKHKQILFCPRFFVDLLTLAKIQGSSLDLPLLPPH